MMIAFLQRLLRRSTAQIGQEEVVARRAILLLVAYLVTIGGLHSAAMVAFEGLTLGDAVWLTVTTVTTVGYGDVSAASAAGRVSTVVLIYVGGIFALAKGAGDYFEYRTSRRLRMNQGRWRWNLQDHVLLINAPRTGAETYFETLVREVRATGWGGDRGVLILTEAWADGLPASLQRLGVVHIHGRGDTDDGLAAADAASAAAIIVLAEEGDSRHDATTFDIVHRLHALDRDCPVLVECVDDRNRDRLRAAGATAVLRPLRGYPEMMVRAMVAPGSEHILEELFTSGGDECLRYEVTLTGVEWGRLAAALIQDGVGTPIAYARAETGAIACNPPPSEPVNAKALYVLVKEGNAVSSERVSRVAKNVG